MPFYYGSSADGSDAKEFRGMYVNPDNSEEWSNMPYNREQRMQDDIIDHISGKRSMREEYDLILQKKSTLPSAHRQYLVGIIEPWLWECFLTGVCD